MKYLCLCFSILFFIGCDKNRIYELNHSLTEGLWHYTDSLRYEVVVEDTAAHYNVYVNIRHTAQYPNANLWLQIQTTYPSGKIMNDRVEVMLARPDGSWMGNCSGNICFVQSLLSARSKFGEEGTYVFHLIQDMRRNPLTEVLDAGLRVEMIHYPAIGN